MRRCWAEEGHKNNPRVAAHAAELAQAKDLPRPGIYVFAHMISEVDDELVELFEQHPEYDGPLGAWRTPPRDVYSV